MRGGKRGEERRRADVNPGRSELSAPPLPPRVGERGGGAMKRRSDRAETNRPPALLLSKMGEIRERRGRHEGGGAKEAGRRRRLPAGLQA